MARRQSSNPQQQAAEAEQLMNHPAMLRAFDKTREAILNEMLSDILNVERGQHLRMQLVNLECVKRNLMAQVQLALVEEQSQKNLGVVR